MCERHGGGDIQTLFGQSLLGQGSGLASFAAALTGLAEGRAEIQPAS